MGFLYQTSAIADTNKYSVSFWVRVNSANLTLSQTIPLLQLGPRQSDLSWNSIGYTSGNAPTTIFSGVSAEIDSTTDFTGCPIIFSGSSVMGAATGYHIENYSAPFYDVVGGRSAIGWFYCIPAFGTGRNCYLRLDDWTHIAYSVRINATNVTFTDFNGPLSSPRFSINSYSNLCAMVNGEDCSPTIPSDSQYDAIAFDEDLTNPAQLSNGPTYPQMLMPAVSANFGITGDISQREWTYMGGADTHDNNWPHTLTPFSAFNLALTSMRFGVPSTNGLIASNTTFNPQRTTQSDINGKQSPIIEYGPFQFWPGQYIDWTNPTNFSKVVKMTAGVGTSENTNIAAAAFGTQAVLFKGGASAFTRNLGSAGSFTKTGTTANFTPTPSYII